jgi:hypothetical protein
MANLVAQAKVASGLTKALIVLREGVFRTDVQPYGLISTQKPIGSPQETIQDSALAAAVTEWTPNQQIMGLRSMHDLIGAKHSENPHHQIGAPKARITALNRKPEWGQWPDRERRP